MTVAEKTKVTMSVNHLREALEACKVAVGNKKNLITATQNVLIKTENGKLTFITTDLEKQVKVVTDVAGDLDVIVSYRTLARFVSKGEGDVELFVKGDTLVVERSGVGCVRLKLQKDFPQEVKLDGQRYPVNAKKFCKMLSILIGACANDDSRPILTGVAIRDGSMASADGFRLYTAKDDDLKFGLAERKDEVVLPSATAKAVLFSKFDKVEVFFDKNKSQVSFKSGNVELVSQLISGAFPDYEQLIPKTYGSKVSFSAPLMSERLESILEDEIPSGILRVVMVKTEKGEDILSLVAGVDETSYELTLPCKHESILGKVGVNIKYMKEAIKFFSKVDLELTSPSSPMKLTGDLEWLTVVIMPMFIHEWGK